MYQSAKTIVIGFIGGLIGTWCGFHFIILPHISQNDPAVPVEQVSNPSSFTYTPSQATNSAIPVDFSEAALKATPSVVFINSISRGVSYSYLDWFFGEGGTSRTQVSSGSGVILSTEGYIVTNYHVIETAERIQVNYNKRIYDAELIGTDPSTDLAVIKINESNLPAITIASSKEVQVGEWVIAVGNPYSLASTVTAGIVSAKGRRIGILEDRFPLESFIQTDAAINPGNSGGALVNKAGNLVGINSAILSRTGSYTGYAFAIPSDIVKKVFNDIVKYGIVQKAFIGGNVVEYNFENAETMKLNTTTNDFKGVILEKVTDNGPAKTAGLRNGDIITRINNIDVDTQSEFEEELSLFNPGDRITLTYMRNNKQATSTLTLVNVYGTTETVKRKIYSSNSLGAQLEATSNGVKVFKIKDNGLMDKIGVPENFTITEINRVRIKNPEDVIEFFETYRGRAFLIGMSSGRQRLQIQFVL